jgi:AcrR family transcriptional regulator
VSGPAGIGVRVAPVIAKPTRRDRAKANIRALMDVARQLWTEGSFDLVSVDDICARAGLAKGTFYNCFDKKDTLLIELVFSVLVPEPTKLKMLLASGHSTPSLCREILGRMAEDIRALPKPLVQLGTEKAFCQNDTTPKLYCTAYDFRSCIREIVLRAVSRGEVQRCWSASALSGALAVSILQGLQFWARGLTPDGAFASDLEERADVLLYGAANWRMRPGATTLPFRRQAS